MGNKGVRPMLSTNFIRVRVCVANPFTSGPGFSEHYLIRHFITGFNFHDQLLGQGLNDEIRLVPPS